jgi:hypothetical protein
MEENGAIQDSTVRGIIVNLIENSLTHIMGDNQICPTILCTLLSNALLSLPSLLFPN